jgi:glycosyltransferase involved in cell wall biosynthesis
MKILMVTPIPPARQATNAVPLVTQAALAALAPRHEVTLVTVAGPDPAELEAVDELQRSGLEVHAVKRFAPAGTAQWKHRGVLAQAWLFKPYPFRTVWYYEPAIQRILDRLLAENRFDLVTVEDNAMGIYRYRTTKPVLLTEVEVRRPRPLHLNRYYGRGKRPVEATLLEIDWHRWRDYQRLVWRRFLRVQVFTARDAASAVEIAPEVADKIRVNPFGIELPPEPEAGTEEDNSIVFTGGMTHQPNVDAAMWLGTEIMPLLRKLRPGVRLSIVGSYPPRSVLDLASDDIIVTGRVPEVEPFIARAAVVVAPVRTGGGQRVKVLQGMSMRKPVVTTQKGMEGLSIVGAEPPLAIANNAEEMAGAISALLESAEARRELGRRARAFVEQYFSPAAYARRLEAVYSEVIEQTSGEAVMTKDNVR